MDKLRGYLVEMAIVAAVGVVLAALGPFGSFAIGGFGARLAYWLPGAFIGYAAFRPAYVLGVAAARRLDFPEASGAIAGVLIGAAPASLLILWWNGARLADIHGPDRWFTLYLQVAILGGLVATLFTLMERARGSGEAPDKQDPAPQPSQTDEPAFHSRLPADIAADLVALEMEDHYVRAHAPGRSTLILIRMRDAQAELASADGMRVHRSWWVARGAVEQVARDGRKVTLKLRGGLEAPVARDRVSDLRSSGWFD